MLYRIYTLADPRNNVVRYIGMTGLTLDSRLATHLRGRGDGTPRGERVAELHALGLTPIIDLIDEVETDFRVNAFRAEQRHIRRYVNLGFDLLNDSLAADRPDVEPVAGSSTGPVDIPAGSVSDQLRFLVSRDGRTQVELAKASGVSVPGLSRFMTGHRNLSVGLSEQLGAAIGYKLALRLGETPPIQWLSA